MFGGCDQRGCYAQFVSFQLGTFSRNFLLFTPDHGMPSRRQDFYKPMSDYVYRGWRGENPNCPCRRLMSGQLMCSRAFLSVQMWGGPAGWLCLSNVEAPVVGRLQRTLLSSTTSFRSSGPVLYPSQKPTGNSATTLDRLLLCVSHLPIVRPRSPSKSAGARRSDRVGQCSHTDSE